MSFKTLALTLSAASILLAAALAFADQPAAQTKSKFEQGQFALSLNHGFTAHDADIFFGGGEIQGSYFVAPNLSLGLGMGAILMSQTLDAKTETVGTTTTTSPEVSRTTTVLRLGPRIGYNIELSDQVSLWPQLGFDYRYIGKKTVQDTRPDQKSSTSAFGLSIYAPIVLHPTSGFFVGAGPAIYTELSNSDTATTTTVATGTTPATTTEKTEDNAKTTALALVATIGGNF